MSEIFDRRAEAMLQAADRMRAERPGPLYGFWHALSDHVKERTRLAQRHGHVPLDPGLEKVCAEYMRGVGE